MYEELLTDVDVMPTQQTGLMDTMKEYLNPSKWMASLDKQKMISMGIYFGAGVLLGFLMKKYANFLITAAITIAAVVALHYVGFLDITVHMDRVQAWFGITMPSLQGDLSFHLMEWAKSNVMLVICFVIGFLIGLKVA